MEPDRIKWKKKINKNLGTMAAVREQSKKKKKRDSCNCTETRS